MEVEGGGLPGGSALSPQPSRLLGSRLYSRLNWGIPGAPEGEAHGFFGWTAAAQNSELRGAVESR